MHLTTLEIVSSDISVNIEDVMISWNISTLCTVHNTCPLVPASYQPEYGVRSTSSIAQPTAEVWFLYLEARHMLHSFGGKGGKSSSLGWLQLYLTIVPHCIIVSL